MLKRRGIERLNNRRRAICVGSSLRFRKRTGHREHHQHQQPAKVIHLSGLTER
jgi:hypothetical protein